VDRGLFYAILPMLPELRGAEETQTPLPDEYSSARDVMGREELACLLAERDLLVNGNVAAAPELLR
jgi:hypothetical protein